MAAILTAFTTWTTTLATDALSVIEDNFPLLASIAAGLIVVGILFKLIRKVVGR